MAELREIKLPKGSAVLEDNASALVSALRDISERGIADLFERFPTQPPPGSILRFERSYGDRRTYTYLALRVDDRWFLTGRQRRVLSWDDLVGEIGANTCHLVTEYTEIPQPPVDPREEIADPREWFRVVYGDGGE